MIYSEKFINTIETVGRFRSSVVAASIVLWLLMAADSQYIVLERPPETVQDGGEIGPAQQCAHDPADIPPPYNENIVPAGDGVYCGVIYPEDSQSAASTPAAPVSEEPSYTG